MYECQFLSPLNDLFLAFSITFKKSAYFFVIIIIFCITFGCIGSELFAYRGRYTDDFFTVSDNLLLGKSYRINYDDFPNAMLSMITCMLNNEWHLSMYSFMKSIGNYVLFFWVFCVFLGTLIVIKLFLAIFLNNYLTIIKDKKLF